MKKMYTFSFALFCFLLFHQSAMAGCINEYVNLDTTICGGQFIIVNGHQYDSTGTYYDTVGICGNSAYRFFTTNLTVTPSLTPSVSIAHLAYVDISQPYMPAYGAWTNNTYDIDNQAKYAFDHDTTNNGWGASSGLANNYLQYDYGAGNEVALTSYGIYLSCAQLGGWCSDGYSPMDWTFQATNGTNWVTLDSITGAALVIGQLSTYNITNTTLYRKYRINITATQSGNYPHITEFYLAGADSLVPPSPITSLDVYDGDNIPENAFDNDTLNYGYGSYGDGLPRWLQYDFGTPQVLNAYSIYNSCDQIGGWCSDGYSPVSWKFEGTNDSVWILLDTISDGQLVIGTKSVFPISNTTAYQKYRFTCTYSTGGDYFRITEMELLQSIGTCGNQVFTAAVTNGSATPSLQWMVNGTNAGTGGYVETFTNLHAGDVISCMLTANNACQTTSTAISNTLVYGLNTSDTTTLTVCKDSLVFNGIPVHTSGTYRDTVTNGQGCDSIYTYVLTVNDCALGINSINEISFKLLPNPNNGLFKLQFSDNAKREIQISNMLGSVVGSFEGAGQQTQLDMTNQPSGIYFVTVTQNAQRKQMRFVLDK